MQARAGGDAQVAMPTTTRVPWCSRLRLTWSRVFWRMASSSAKDFMFGTSKVLMNESSRSSVFHPGDALPRKASSQARISPPESGRPPSASGWGGCQRQTSGRRSGRSARSPAFQELPATRRASSPSGPRGWQVHMGGLESCGQRRAGARLALQAERAAARQRALLEHRNAQAHLPRGARGGEGISPVSQRLVRPQPSSEMMIVRVSEALSSHTQTRTSLAPAATQVFAPDRGCAAPVQTYYIARYFSTMAGRSSGTRRPYTSSLIMMTGARPQAPQAAGVLQRSLTSPVVLPWASREISLSALIAFAP